MQEEKYLTFVFEIKDKEKFAEFHKKMFPSTQEEEQKVIDNIGARVCVSSWGNLHKQNEKLENCLSEIEENLHSNDYEEIFYKSTEKIGW
jgi:hypothetical protein